MNFKEKKIATALIIYLSILVACFIDYMHSGNLPLFLLTITIVTAIALVMSTRLMKVKPVKKKQKLPAKIGWLFLAIFLIFLIAISISSSYTYLSYSLFLLDFTVLTVAQSVIKKKQKVGLKLPYRYLMIVYVIFLLMILTFSENGGYLFPVTVTLGLLSLYSFIRPEKFLLIISLMYFALAEIIVFACIYIVVSGSIAYFFYAWAVINTLAVAYTLKMLMKLSKT